MKATLAKLYLLYDEHFPVQRGKARTANLLTDAIGAVQIRSRAGPTLEVFLNSQQDRHLVRLNESKDDQALNAIELLKQGDVFVDIGANIGFYSLLAAFRVGKTGRVLSFEPSFREYRRLLKNIEINDAPAVVPFNVGLSRESEIKDLAIATSHTGLNSLARSSRFESYCQPTPVFSFDWLWRQLFGPQRIDLIKIDVEGAESWVLEGMRWTLSERLPAKVIVEVTPKFLKDFGASKRSIYELMRGHGYVPLIRDESWQYDEVFVPGDS